MADDAVPLFDAIAAAASAGKLDDPNRTPTKFTFGGAIRDGDAAALSKQVDVIRQAVAVMSGANGPTSLLDKALTARDLIQAGLLTINAGGTVTGLGTGLVLNNGGAPQFGGFAYEAGDLPGTFLGFPTLATPPTPTNLKANGTYKAVILTWDLLDYANHGYTEIWRSADNNLGHAILIGTAVGKIYVDENSIDLGIQHWYWVRDVSNDTIPVTGSYNAGVGAGTAGGAGFIGGVDIAPLAVSADKLSQGTYPNINLIPNPGSEDGLEAWAVYEQIGSGGTFTLDTVTRSGGNSSFKLTKAAGANGISANCRGFPVIPGETYSVKIRAQADAAGSAIFRILEQTTTPAAPGFIARTSYTDLFLSSPATSMTGYEFFYTAPAGVHWAALAVYLWTGGAATTLNFDDCSFGRQITATFLAAGSIAVGTAAIQNGAIVNAMIGNAAIDTAQIANLAVATAKLADAAITTAKIADAQIVQAKIGFAAVGSAEIQTAAITTAKIADANITTAKIVDGNITNAKIGGQITSSNYIPGIQGWSIDKAGDSEFNTATFRGALAAATGTFAGSLSAATGTFAGALSAATGSFSGSLSAATGTFAGSLTTAALQVAGHALFSPGFGGSSTPFVTTNRWATCVTAGSVNPGSGGAVAITVMAEWSGTTTITGGGENGDSFIDQFCRFRLLCNGSLIKQWSPRTSGASITYLHSPGGAAVYSLQVILGDETIVFNADSGGRVYERSILVQGVVQ